MYISKKTVLQGKKGAWGRKDFHKQVILPKSAYQIVQDKLSLKETLSHFNTRKLNFMIIIDNNLD